MNMNKTFLVFVLAFLLIGSASAYLEDSNLEITLNPDSSIAKFTLGSIEEEYDKVEVPFSCSDGELVIGEGLPDFLNEALSSNSEEFCSALNNPFFNEDEGTFSFYVSDFTEGIDFTANFVDGANYPTFSSISINGNIPIELNFETPMTIPFEVEFPFTININGYDVTFISLTSISITLDNILQTSTGYSASEITPDVLNDIIQEANENEVPMEGTASLIKLEDNNEYTLNYNRGFGDNPEQYISQIEEIIELNAIYTFNLQNLMIPSELLTYSDFDYDVSVDLSSLNLVNGIHYIPITLSQNGEDIATKEITLTLSGLPEEEEEEIPEEEPTPSHEHHSGSTRVVGTFEEVPENTLSYNNEEPIDLSDNKPKDKNPFINFLTGAVTGIANFAKTGLGLVIIALTVGITATGVAIASIKRFKKIRK